MMYRNPGTGVPTSRRGEKSRDLSRGGEVVINEVD